MQDLRLLRRDEVIGHRISSVQALDTSQGDHDFVTIYLVLDNGITTFVPLACCPFFEIILPENAVPLTGAIAVECQSSLSSKVHAIQGDDGFIDPDSLVIEMDSGLLIFCVGAAPHGTGRAGLHCCNAGEMNLSLHTDYWELDWKADENRLAHLPTEPN
ncbi:MAG: hypothetical protein V4675_06005 [Verrucomicrobiota bacterium]